MAEAEKSVKNQKTAITPTRAENAAVYGCSKAY